MYFYFCFENGINATIESGGERACSEKRTYNMQCTNFTDTSLDFISTSDPFSTEQSTENVFREKYIRCRYRDCVYRALHWNISYFFLFCFTILFLSTESGFVLSTESGRQQHGVYSKGNIFCARLNVL